MRLNLLKVLFNLTTDSPDLFSYINAFKQAYGNDEATPFDFTVEVIANVGDLYNLPTIATVPVHKSNSFMEYWTFDANIHENNAEHIIATWPEKRLSLKFEKQHNRLILTIDPTVEKKYAGEFIFHSCRSFALYLRRAESGNLFHATGIELNDKGVLFTGIANAGKSTLLTESIIKFDASPICNDRVLITSDTQPMLISWPGYASYCEGTILNYPQLKEAADKYEIPSYPYKTQSYPYPLKMVFHKGKRTKRIYPMIWLTDAIGKKYVQYAALKCIVLSTISTDIEIPKMEILDLNDQTCKQNLIDSFAALIFDFHETTFIPWHGFSLPSPTPNIKDTVQRLHESGVKFIKYQAPATDLSSLSELFKLI